MSQDLYSIHDSYVEGIIEHPRLGLSFDVLLNRSVISYVATQL